MSGYLDTAIGVDISGAVAAVVAAAVTEATRQSEGLLGGFPSSDGAADRGADPTWSMASQLLQLRLELGAGIDPLGTVIGLRRWGATWELISRAAGTSRQAAYDRWGRRVREVLDRYGTGELGGPVAKDEMDLSESAPAGD